MENISLQIDMNVKEWQNTYNFAHNYSGQMNYQSSKAIQDVDVTNKDTLDVMEENILKCS